MILYFNVFSETASFLSAREKKSQTSLLFTVLYFFYLKKCVALAVQLCVMERVHTFHIFNIHDLSTDKTVWSLATVSTVNTAQSAFMSESFKYVK